MFLSKIACRKIDDESISEAVPFTPSSDTVDGTGNNLCS